MTPVRKALQDAGLRASDLKKVLMVGGSTCLLYTSSISQPLEKLMEARKPYQSPGAPEKTLLPCEDVYKRQSGCRWADPPG